MAPCICLGSVSFGTMVVKEGTWVLVDTSNPYIQALLDNGLLMESETSESGELHPIEKKPILSANECGLQWEAV